MPKFFTVSDLARDLGCKPRDISDLLYDRQLPVDECPMIGRARAIPEHLVPLIRQKLAERTERRQQREVAAV